MSDRIQVTCRNRKRWGSKVFGVTGAIYYIAEGGALHVLLQGGVQNPEPGVLDADADEFEKYDYYRVERPESKIPAPAVPPPPGPAGSEVSTPETNGPQEPPAPVVSLDSPPSPDATMEEWLNWARSNGIALSPAQKRANKTELIQTITDLARDKAAAQG